VSGRRNGPRVTVVSPHFDDAPLSLGQSMLDGTLSRCRVQVVVVFGRTNWTRWVHPTRGRALPISLWRRAEETAAAVAFRYRLRVLDHEELVLRAGETDPEVLRDGGVDVRDDPLLPVLTAQLRRLRGSADVVLFPAGLGDHRDHRLVAAAGSALQAQHDDGLGFYEDRPYVGFLTGDERRAQLSRLGDGLVPVDLSGPVTPRLNRLLRRCYPSQIHDVFASALDADLAAGARERAWFPAPPPATLGSAATGTVV
jgi:LmbE family N-acetylglucosaminyl deacetylase